MSTSSSSMVSSHIELSERLYRLRREAESSEHNEISSVLSTESNSPSPRVGTASAWLNDKIYLFSGRGGEAMSPIEENGALWVFDPALSAWSLLPPSSSTAPRPAARSYHSLASNGVDRIYLHAGCPVTGRLSDLWAFNIDARSWTQLADAPAPPRGGTSIAFSGGLLYRLNGFDGETEQGGTLDIYDPATDSWSSKAFAPNGAAGPTPRSVSALLPITIGGNASLVTLFGEHDPSSLGHQGAGKMLGDVWAYDIGLGRWQEVAVTNHGSERPLPRGWFAADVVLGEKIVVQGGLGESNERLDDLWVLSF